MGKQSDNRSNHQRSDTYSRITDKIIAELALGVRPWTKPWTTGYTSGGVTRPLRHNGQPYSGINVLILWSEAIARGFVSSRWMTFRQAIELGGAVRKGETGTNVVFASSLLRTETTETGTEIERDIPFLKAYTVFNTDQITGLDRRNDDSATIQDPMSRIGNAGRFFVNTGALVRHGGTAAYYAAGRDYIQLPCFDAFRDDAAYVAVLSHEMTHYAVSRIMPNLIRRALRSNTNSELMVGIIAIGFLSVCYTGRWKSVLASSTKALISHPEAWSLMSPIACMNA